MCEFKWSFADCGFVVEICAVAIWINNFLVNKKHKHWQTKAYSIPTVDLRGAENYCTYNRSVLKVKPQRIGWKTLKLLKTDIALKNI